MKTKTVKRKGTAVKARPSSDNTAVVAETNPCNCGASSHETLGQYEPQEYGGIGPDGNPYEVIYRSVLRCCSCGQTHIQRRYGSR